MSALFDTTDEPNAVRFASVAQDDPLAKPLIRDLAAEYSARYGRTLDVILKELTDYPREEFAAPGGALLVALSAGTAIAGGAYRRYDETTAELKRIWTSKSHRGRGFGRLVVAELERSARDRGYRRIYLTTGWNQPEAVALYLAAGYTPLYDTTASSESVGVHPFEKHLARPSGSIGTRTGRPRMISSATPSRATERPGSSTSQQPPDSSGEGATAGTDGGHARERSCS